MLTEEYLKEIERRVQQASAGPWVSYVEGRDHTSGSSFIMTGPPDNRGGGRHRADRGDHCRSGLYRPGPIGYPQIADGDQTSEKNAVRVGAFPELRRFSDDGSRLKMLDVYFLTDYDHRQTSSLKKDRRFGLDNYDLFEPGFEFLRSKTGVCIDEYGDARLYPDHQRLLLEYWKDDRNEDVRRFTSFLSKAIDENEVLLFIGD